MRFRMGEFAELFGGLETTINNFNDKVVISKSLPNNKIMILFLPKNVNLEKVSQALHSLWSVNHKWSTKLIQYFLTNLWTLFSKVLWDLRKYWTKILRPFEENQEANYTHPLHNAACMRTPVTRWELYDNRLSCQLPDIIRHF